MRISVRKLALLLVGIAACWPCISMAQGFDSPSSVDDALDASDSNPLSQRIDLGLDYFALGMVASGGRESEAASGVARLFGTLNLYDEHVSGSGKFTFKVENRHRLGADVVPQDFGFANGYVGNPATGFSNAGWLLTNLFYQHNAVDDRWGFLGGITDVTDYVDVYALGNTWKEFSNLAFSTNPTIPAPSQGFGMAGLLRLGRQGYVIGGIADANGNPSDPFDGLADFFDNPEVFAHAEFGWVGDWEDRFSDNIHLTVWSVAAREAAGVPSGHGAALSFSWRFENHFIPFVRVGASDGGGALLERSASIGFGYETGRGDDRIGLGINWGRPNRDEYGAGAQDQTTLEAYWRFGIMEHLEVTPDIQFVYNPALEPRKDHITLMGLRLHAFF